MYITVRFFRFASFGGPNRGGTLVSNDNLLGQLMMFNKVQYTTHSRRLLIDIWSLRHFSRMVRTLFQCSTSRRRGMKVLLRAPLIDGRIEEGKFCQHGTIKGRAHLPPMYIFRVLLRAATRRSCLIHAFHNDTFAGLRVRKNRPTPLHALPVRAIGHNSHASTNPVHRARQRA